MGKSKGKSTMKVKLQNKSANKRMKASRLYKLNKQRNAPKEINIPSNVKNKKTASKSIIVENIQETSHLEVEDINFTDEEMEEFVNENVGNLSFLSSSLNKSEHKCKRRKKADDTVPDFEKTARLSRFIDSEKDNGKRKFALLPIKGENGLIHQQGDRVIENEEPIQAESDPKESLGTSEVRKLTAIEELAQSYVDINDKKVKIGQLSLEIIENPESNITCLKQLLSLCVQHQPISIQKLSMLSLLEVFKDIIPSYRIRELNEDEKSVKVKRDVRKIRDYEEGLLSGYKQYLQLLEDMIRDCLKVLHHSDATMAKHLKTMVILSTKCLAELLSHAPHFNFRTNIIAVLVPKMELTGDCAQAAQICLDTVKSVFQNDPVGDVSLHIVKLINKHVKGKPNVKPEVLETFLSLRINADAVKMAAERGNKKERLQQKREALSKMSRKERKRKKIEEKLDKELQETEAVESREKVEKAQTEIVKFVFVTYFRVLKNSSSSLNLLAVVLRGLSKFAHLINIEFFDDLMACFRNLLTSDSLGTNQRLHCISTALTILSGQGEAFVIDPRQFYTEAYNILPYIGGDFSDDNLQMTNKCLEIMLFKRRKQVSLPQVQGFFKRLSTIVLQMTPSQAIDSLSMVRNILQLHKKCDFLLDSESIGGGVFQCDVTAPEHSNSSSSALWELTLLNSHFHSPIVTYARHILNGAPSQGPGALPARVLARANSLDYVPVSLQRNKKTVQPKLRVDEKKFEEFIAQYKNPVRKIDRLYKQFLKSNL